MINASSHKQVLAASQGHGAGNTLIFYLSIIIINFKLVIQRRGLFRDFFKRIVNFYAFWSMDSYCGIVRSTSNPFLGSCYNGARWELQRQKF